MSAAMRSSVLIKPRSSISCSIGIRRQCEGGGRHRKQMLEESVLLQQPVGLRTESRQEQLQDIRRTIAPAARRPASTRAWLIGASVCGSIEKSSLAANRTGTQHAHRILAISRLRIADQLQAPRTHIADAVDEIPDLKNLRCCSRGRWRRNHAATHPPRWCRRYCRAGCARCGRRRDVRNRQRQPARPRCHRAVRPLALRVGIGILGIFPFRRRGRAKGRHLDDFLPEMHVSETKAPADQAAIAKQVPHLFRQGVGRHVEILRRDTQQQIADRPAHQKSLVSRIFEPVQHFQGVGRDRRTRYRMLRAGDDQRGPMGSTMRSKRGVPLESKKLARILPALFGSSAQNREHRSLRLEA